MPGHRQGQQCSRVARFAPCRETATAYCLCSLRFARLVELRSPRGRGRCVPCLACGGTTGSLAQDRTPALAEQHSAPLLCRGRESCSACFGRAPSTRDVVVPPQAKHGRFPSNWPRSPERGRPGGASTISRRTPAGAWRMADRGRRRRDDAKPAFAEHHPSAGAASRNPESCSRGSRIAVLGPGRTPSSSCSVWGGRIPSTRDLIVPPQTGHGDSRLATPSAAQSSTSQARRLPVLKTHRQLSEAEGGIPPARPGRGPWRRPG